MKIRMGFVSNSSTSSFTCDVCGEKFTGMDLCPSDVDVSMCQEGHYFCNSHSLQKGDVLREDVLKSIRKYVSEDLLKGIETREHQGKIIDEWSDEEVFDLALELDDGMAPCFCPICSFQTFAQSDLVAYIVKTRGISRDHVFNYIREKNKRRKKLHDYEYIEYALRELKVTEEKLLEEVICTFNNNYEEFNKFI